MKKGIYALLTIVIAILGYGVFSSGAQASLQGGGYCIQAVNSDGLRSNEVGGCAPQPTAQPDLKFESCSFALRFGNAAGSIMDIRWSSPKNGDVMIAELGNGNLLPRADSSFENGSGRSQIVAPGLVGLGETRTFGIKMSHSSQWERFAVTTPITGLGSSTCIAL